jgi:hypothetical protein
MKGVGETGSQNFSTYLANTKVTCYIPFLFAAIRN